MKKQPQRVFIFLSLFDCVTFATDKATKKICAKKHPRRLKKLRESNFLISKVNHSFQWHMPSPQGILIKLKINRVYYTFHRLRTYPTDFSIDYTTQSKETLSSLSFLAGNTLV
jgi:hypothetical protein